MAAVAAAAAGWRQVLAWAQSARLLFVTHHIYQDQPDAGPAAPSHALAMWLPQVGWSLLPLSLPSHYWLALLYGQRRDDVGRTALFTPAPPILVTLDTWFCYRRGWQLLWLRARGRGDTAVLDVVTLRGAFDINKLVLAACTAGEVYTRGELAFAEDVDTRCCGMFFTQSEVVGNAGQPMLDGGMWANRAERASDPAQVTMRASTTSSLALSELAAQGLYPALGVDSAELRQRVNLRLRAACSSATATTGSMIAAERDFQRWMLAKDWYKSRQILWRRGWLLQGPPGNGKTSFVRRLAERYRLTLVRVSLATLTTPQLRLIAERNVPDTPTVVLFDDIDCVFNGRDNVSTLAGSVTYDAFLGWLDSDRRDGTLVVLTTNRPELLDATLTSRPGRIDATFTFDNPASHERQELLERTLDDPCDREALAAEWAARPLPPSLAQCAEAAQRLACERYWAQQNST